MKKSTFWILGGAAIAAGLWWLSKQNTAPALAATPAPALPTTPATLTTINIAPISGGIPNVTTDNSDVSLPGVAFYGSGFDNQSADITGLIGGNPLSGD